MKIKLIAPARKQEWGESFWDLEPFVKLTGRKTMGTWLALPTLAALTPADDEVVITDENIEPINFDEKVDLIGITALTSLAPRAYEIADVFRSKGVPVVMGGIHASMCPEEAIEHVDSVVIGEADEIWPKLISDFKAGALQRFYKAEHNPSLENAPIPRWDLLKTDAYCHFTVQTARGCPFECDFCSVHAFNGRDYRHKKIENIVKEIELLKSLDPKKLIFMADDNLLSKPSYARELLKAIEPLNIRFWIQASINRLDDDEILDMLYMAGCRVVLIGLESVSQKSLDAINKSKVNNVERYKKVIKKIQSAGIGVFGSFIVGMDTDDAQIFEDTAKFVKDSNVAFALLNILTPFPGTKLYDRLMEEKRIVNGNWQYYDVDHLCIEPKMMSGEELLRYRRQFLQEINDYPALYSRLKNAWDEGAFIRDKGNKVALATKGRILFTIKSLMSTDLKKTRFILKSLWNPKVTSATFIALALGVHDYAYRLSKKNSSN